MNNMPFIPLSSSESSPIINPATPSSPVNQPSPAHSRLASPASISSHSSQQPLELSLKLHLFKFKLSPLVA